MRDIKLFYIEGTGFDVDIINGEPVYVDYENQTQDQRAAVAAAIVKGTIPGELDIGVDWSLLYEKKASVLEMHNDIEQMIQASAGGDGEAGSSYLPLFVPKANNSIDLTVIKGVTQ